MEAKAKEKSKFTVQRLPIKSYKQLFLTFLLVFVFIFSLMGCNNKKLTLEEELLYQGEQYEKQMAFSNAKEKYSEAFEVLQMDGDNALLRKCGEALQRISLFEELYCFDRETIIALIEHTYPGVNSEQIDYWLMNDELEYYTWDNEKHYFVDSVVNLQYRHMELMFSDEASQLLYSNLIQAINEDAKETPEHLWMPFQNPLSYRGTHKVSIERSLLPEMGTYRIWFPLPINSGPQANVSIEKIYPEKWVKYPVLYDQDIGIVYMEIPMEELSEDLEIEIVFSYTHFEHRFIIDSSKVGMYDKESEIYQKYTKSTGNTEITQAIRQKAEEIVQGETNPCLAARKIYDYIVNNIDYSFVPHYLLFPRTNLTEAQYVHLYKRGDCGSQSIYFSALCRSLGIPARATGGFQLFSGEFGTHFWAEFYLPNYGWIPVDTSGAQLALYVNDLSSEDRQTFIDYYFGSQDAMRCIVQKDIDTPLIPEPEGLVLFPGALQAPTTEYSLPTGEIVEILVQSNWTFSCEKLNP